MKTKKIMDLENPRFDILSNHHLVKIIGGVGGSNDPNPKDDQDPPPDPGEPSPIPPSPNPRPV